MTQEPNITAEDCSMMKTKAMIIAESMIEQMHATDKRFKAQITQHTESVNSDIPVEIVTDHMDAALGVCETYQDVLLTYEKLVNTLSQFVSVARSSTKQFELETRKWNPTTDHHDMIKELSELEDPKRKFTLVT